MIALVLPTKAQENVHNWAIYGHLGGSESIVTHNDRDGDAAQMGFNRGFGVEYYVPFSPFSVYGGLLFEDFTFLNGDASREITEIQLGGRWYPTNRQWVINPYLGAEVLTSLSALSEDTNCTSSLWNSSTGKNYLYSEMVGNVKVPRFSVAPTVGLDIKVLSSLSLTMEYSFRVALGGKAETWTTFPPMLEAFNMRSNLHRHAFAVGLKVNFPFTLHQRGWRHYS